MATIPNVNQEACAQKPLSPRRSLNLPLVTSVTLLLLVTARLVLAVTRYSVNLIYWDQWDFYTPLFGRSSLWHVFTWEHTPVREGIGLVLDKFVLDWTAWDTRAEALFMVGVLFAAAILALVLKHKLFGRLDYTDCIIPCLFLTFAQLEGLIGEENPSYAVFPELLTILYCLAWMIPKRRVRYATVLFINFLLIYTGFGIFMGIVTVGILLLDLRRTLRVKAESSSYPALAVLVAVLSLASFFYHYRWDPTLSCPFPDRHPWNYAWFASLLMSYFLGLRAVVVASVVGAFVTAGALAILVYSGVRLWRNRGWSPVDLNVTILLGFTFIFAANAAVGRTCQGMPEAAQFSRYMGLLVPAFLAMYFHLLTWRNKQWRVALTVLLLAATLPGSFRIPNGYSPQFVHDGKLAWKTCMLQTGNIGYCDQVTGFPVYPLPRRTHLLEKLEFLRSNHLNLYSDSR
jgi:hypothetical protein